MSYCPICKTEYNTGITICPECNVGLLESESRNTVAVFSLQKEDTAQRFVDYAADQGLAVSYEYMMREDAYKIYVNKSDMKATLKLFASFHMMELKRKNEEEAAKLAAEVPEEIAAPEEIPDVPPENVSIEASDLPEDAVDATDNLSAPMEEPVEEQPLESDLTVDLPEVGISEPEPVAVSEEPAAVYEEPVIVSEEPAAVYEEPVTVSEEPAVYEEPISSPVIEEDHQPIFVETERVSESELNEESVIDPSFIEFTPVNENKTPVEFDDEVLNPVLASEPKDSAPVFEQAAETAVNDTVTLEPEEPEETEEQDAFSDFLTNFKRASLSKSQKQTTVESEPVSKEDAPAVEDAAPITEEAAPIIEEIDPKKDYNTDDYQSIPFRPTDISDSHIKVTADSLISEEVLDGTSTAPEIDMTAVANAAEEEPDEPEESVPVSEPVSEPKAQAAAPVKKDLPPVAKAAPKVEKSMNEELDELDTYVGFVPDYSVDETTDEPRELTAEEKAMAEFKKKAAARHSEVMAKAAERQKEATHQASLVKELSNGQKIVFKDDEELDNYAGFVPDYTPNTTNEDEFDFYKPHTIGSYAKYKKGKGKEGTVSLANTYMRAVREEELKSIFVTNIPTNVKRTINANDLKTGSFIVSMSGSQLTKLFNSWMMMNITPQTVHTFEKLDASAEENMQAKLNGIKDILKTSFGDLNDGFLDAIVTRYYNKYLDD